MSNESIPVTIQIMDSEYRLVCPEAECEALLEAGRYLNQKMLEIRDAGKVFGVDRIAVMAALNIAYELIECRHEGAELDHFTDQRVQDLLHKVELALNKSAQIEV